MALNTIYPGFGVYKLREQRGIQWRNLVDGLRYLPLSDTRVMAFSYTMRRLRSYLNLEHSSCHKPLCAVCSADVLAQFEGSEDDLMLLYEEALRDIQTRIRTRATRRHVRRVAVA